MSAETVWVCDVASSQPGIAGNH